MTEQNAAWWRATLAGAVLAAASVGGCAGSVVRAPSDAAVVDTVVVDVPPTVEASVVDTPPTEDALVVDMPPAMDAPVIDNPPVVDALFVDTPPVIDAPTVTCDAGTTLCGATCVATATDVSHCGVCNRPCGTAQSCVMGACACAAGQHPVGTVCVADDAPRPFAPTSLGDVTQRRPTLRWALPAGIDGAVVELCRDRACASVIETLRVTGTSARPAADLPARSTVFWRLRGRVGDAERSGASATWMFHVPARSASTSVDSSFNPHFDVNGDGFDDVVVGAYQANPGGRDHAGAASVFYGSATWTQPAAGIARPPDRLFEGAATGDLFGWSVASAGDLNGDGYADLVVGAIVARPGGRRGAGTASVYYGSATWTQPAAGTARTPDRVLEGAATEDQFGWSVASAGDVNGDGYADLVVGANLADPGGRDHAGTASVFYGSATWTQPAAGTARPPDRLFEGAAGDLFGASVASAGDANGDGYADLVVGAYRANPGGRTQAGTASVYYGSAAWTQPAAGTVRPPDRLFEGAAAYDAFGWSLASTGDLNGDGYADVVVGAPGADPGGREFAGTASVFYGSATWTQPAAGTARPPDRLFEGAVGDGGSTSAGAGDVNGDGYADLAVGTWFLRATPHRGTGTVRVFYGSAAWTQPAAGTVPTPDRLLEGTAANDGFGAELTSAGDVNGDGYADLVVGAFEAGPGGRPAAGTASVFYGSATWTQPAVGTVPTPDRLLEGAAAGDVFGWSVASADGITGDGFDDLIVGSYLVGSRGRSFAGAAPTSGRLFGGLGIHPIRPRFHATIRHWNPTRPFGRWCPIWGRRPFATELPIELAGSSA